ncbi:oxidation resistance protein 1, partial [Phtheirospermum japonicum]
NSEKSCSDAEEESKESVDGPDTSSFSSFLYSFIASSKPHQSNSDKNTDTYSDESKQSSETIITKENVKRKSLFSRGKHTLGKAFYQAAKIGGFRNQASQGNSDMAVANGSNSNGDGISMQILTQSVSLEKPETSEPSLLLCEKTLSVIYPALPVIVQGRKWMLLYSTWRHGISLSTLYRRSMIWPGLSMLVVGDRKGAVFGGLVEAPLRPTSKRRYQGSNNSFVFTNVSGHPLIFRPTGMNRYFTLCSTEYLAMGGGGHFAIYLDGDLLSGSSSSSETYDNPCLACSEDFEVKEVELWGFVYASKYEEMMALSRTETPGICHW